MGRFFTRERFGRPQLAAAALLMAFLAQASWLVHREFRASGETIDAGEQLRLAAGWQQLQGGAIAGAPYPDTRILPLAFYRDDYHGNFDSEHSPLLPLVTAAPLLILPQRMLDSGFSSDWRWLIRIPFLAAGVFLGASLWYVARRLCGNHGGLLALGLYCFSPAMIQASAVWHTEPEILGAWGWFGTIFTSIAVAHTLYAPREVVLWNWRRIVLLGVALAIAVGSQFSMIVVVPPALFFLLYLAPIRRGAGFVIWITACLAGIFLLFASYFFRWHAFAESMRHAVFWGATWHSFMVPGVYAQVAGLIFRGCAALAMLLPVALVAYALWPRVRYFGNTAPGLVALLLIILGIAHPHEAGAGFLLASMPFLLIFVSGVIADLLETSFRLLIISCISGLMIAYVLFDIANLIRVKG
ncbi:MAG TPA: glycosyltransferase family 39 protein [Candidatus Binatia bacterium]|nr:glycosyltransferase family 39 protein [Candidatus Binatia bacterium]